MVWRVVDTAEALFNVDDYNNFVQVQSESALRNLATQLPLRSPTWRGRWTLAATPPRCRSGSLKTEIQERLAQAGVEVLEARISHLAYAPEIAHGDAAAPAGERGGGGAGEDRRGRGGHGRDGAGDARHQGIVELDTERKAAMVSNLLVVLCGGGHRSRWSTSAACTTETALAERKKYLLRIDPEIYESLRRWAGDELRSVNAQIEFLLARALREAGRAPKPSPPAPLPTRERGEGEGGPEGRSQSRPSSRAYRGSARRGRRGWRHTRVFPAPAASAETVAWGSPSSAARQVSPSSSLTRNPNPTAA